jgi:hypothetical protein
MQAFETVDQAASDAVAMLQEGERLSRLWRYVFVQMLDDYTSVLRHAGVPAAARMWASASAQRSVRKNRTDGPGDSGYLQGELRSIQPEGSYEASCSVTSRIPSGPTTWNAQGAVFTVRPVAPSTVRM